MIGAFIGAAGSIIGGAQRAGAAKDAVKAASKDRMSTIRLAQDDYRNNMAQREADQRDLDAISDDMQAKYDRARDFDQARSDAYRDRDQMVADALAQDDQRRAIEYARSDEARMLAAHREAVGYDLDRLVADAKAAGFNPLTVLGATGGSAYAREAAPVVSTPFVSRQLVGSSVIGSLVAERQFAPRPLIDTAGVFGSMSQTLQAARSDRVQSAGYVADTVGALGEAYMGYTSEQARLAADRDLAEAIRFGGSAGASVGGGSARKPGAIMTARTVDARPVGNVPSTGLVGAALPSQSGPGANDLLFGGFPWYHAPDTSVMDDIETVYGDSEILSTVAGAGVFGRDLAYNTRLAREWAGRRAKEIADGMASWLPPASSRGDMLSVGP